MLIETIEATSGLYSRVVKVERIEISCRNIYIYIYRDKSETFLYVSTRDASALHRLESLEFPGSWNWLRYNVIVTRLFDNANLLYKLLHKTDWIGISNSKFNGIL